MSNPFSGTEIPGMNAMGDTLSFVKKLWGGMQVPGMVAPPMSVDELDKKITDLKTVESWLTVNMNMLRGTIQALEVQRATIATLQSLGESFAQHAQQATAMAEQATSSFSSAPAAAATPAASGNADWPMHPATAKMAEPEPDPDEEIDEETDDMPPDANAAQAEVETAAKMTNKTAGKTVEPSEASTQFVNPAAWWGLLQEQFKQAVSKALEGEQIKAATETVPEKKMAAKKTDTKPAAPKSTSKAPAVKTAKAAKPASKAKPAASSTSAKAGTKKTTRPAAKSVATAVKTSKGK
ncbi:PhaM family polyhydroxyalkanoate granule multifunctional regulatory protein [Undibacterium sp. TJN19]|uniref:PhaM family polyhydroxyalkanoate granule multifunctional regulatory protein n=1 Tax=Undibacterium sp. TJN19 TaxID=3413055 RepID=UPI003BF2EBA0